MTWTRLTVHWIISDCDLGKVSVCTLSRGCVGLNMRWASQLQPLELAEWKWEHVMMDFVTHLPRKPQGHDAVWVIVDRLTKLAHFLAVRMTFTFERFCRLYIREIVRLHGVPVSIVSDRDPRFTAHF